MTGTIRIAVVDDHPLFREGVMRILREVDGLDVVGEGGSGADAVRLVADVGPDILLMDISMPDGGLETIPAVLAARPGQKIVMLTVSESGDDVTRAMRSGAMGYVLKGIGAKALAEVLVAVAAGERYVSPTLSARLLTAAEGGHDRPDAVDPLAQLTPRERDVACLVASGLSNKRVALRLDLHEKTVKHHMTRVLAKLNVSNRTEAALLLHRAGCLASTDEASERPWSEGAASPVGSLSCR
ncbi:response regulator transcription factor [Aquibium carbonis]|uniref:Response regulator transcription factor n=1 Tax=Aquibium carbonis TaxID=2495581 RepID=A0A429YS99_9HYPH|nr:response regulator transcription factor [Aquibium carbonis]RST84323.1 response regulator transcription factor [Aquibium carbonis]